MMATLDTVHIVAENIEKFSSLFYKILAESKDENLICSPLSVSVLLSMLTYGARGATGELLKAVLHFTDDDTTNKNSYQTLIDFFNAIETVQLKLANRIYVGNDVIIEHDYQQLTETYFRSTIGNVNFHNKEEACAIINCWCEEKTNNRIKNAIRPENITHDMKMVMVNAIYFKGNWKNKFNALNTTPKAFHIDSTHSKRVPMMRKTGRYKFSIISEINARCIELPYEVRILK
uniref:SPI3_1 protein n=1 Tax=Fopius arisanus TaxID=64838 RepID=A0A0C9RQ21_9HYME